MFLLLAVFLLILTVIIALLPFAVYQEMHSKD